MVINRLYTLNLHKVTCQLYNKQTKTSKQTENEAVGTGISGVLSGVREGKNYQKPAGGCDPSETICEPAVTEISLHSFINGRLGSLSSVVGRHKLYITWQAWVFSGRVVSFQAHRLVLLATHYLVVHIIQAESQSRWRLRGVWLEFTHGEDPCKYPYAEKFSIAFQEAHTHTHTKAKQKHSHYFFSSKSTIYFMNKSESHNYMSMTLVSFSNFLIGYKFLGSGGGEKNFPFL